MAVTLHPKGMKNMSPAAVDSSQMPAKGSVNNGAVRKGVAPTPRSLGPRTA